MRLCPNCKGFGVPNSAYKGGGHRGEMRCRHSPCDSTQLLQSVPVCQFEVNVAISSSPRGGLTSLMAHHVDQEGSQRMFCLLFPLPIVPFLYALLKTAGASKRGRYGLSILPSFLCKLLVTLNDKLEHSRNSTDRVNLLRTKEGRV